LRLKGDGNASIEYWNGGGAVYLQTL